MKIIFARILLLSLLMIGINVHGQKVGASQNSVYENFSNAYLEMDADIIDHIYVEDAVLLNLYDSSSPSSIRGNTEIKNFFSDMFKRFEENGQKLELSFKITNRKIIDSTTLDNGFYKLTIISPDLSKVNTYGKLSTVLKLENGNWKFKVDANTNTDEVEYINADTGSISQPK